MSTQRKRYSAEFKARVALEAIKGHKTVNELASTYGVHPTQITHWKQQFPLMTCESYMTMASDSSLSISTIRFLSFEETSAIRHHRISCCKPTHLVIAA